ncbi:hypothetical protein OF83DRAFT_1174145 [Amylostereum chailletii]|nr:hypothetical protein OF83DRAFT_1174145 [Amylostereum chailletii]
MNPTGALEDTDEAHLVCEIDRQATPTPRDTIIRSEEAQLDPEAEVDPSPVPNIRTVYLYGFPTSNAFMATLNPPESGDTSISLRHTQTGVEYIYDKLKSIKKVELNRSIDLKAGLVDEDASRDPQYAKALKDFGASVGDQVAVLTLFNNLDVVYN